MSNTHEDQNEKIKQNEIIKNKTEVFYKDDIDYESPQLNIIGKFVLTGFYDSLIFVDDTIEWELDDEEEFPYETNDDMKVEN